MGPQDADEIGHAGPILIIGPDAHFKVRPGLVPLPGPAEQIGNQSHVVYLRAKAPGKRFYADACGLFLKFFVMLKSELSRRAGCFSNTAMKNLREKLEQLRADAEDCSLISRLATDKAKRETFARLAGQLRQMALDIEQLIANKVAPGEK